MKNEASFLAMQEAILEVVARARHGIDNDVDETDPIAIGQQWLGEQILQLVVENNIQDYIYYTHLVQNDKVLVIGVQEESVPGGEQDPDKLFYCEVARISASLLTSWVAKGKPTTEQFLTAERVDEFKNRSMEWSDSQTKYVEFLNEFIKASRT